MLLVAERVQQLEALYGDVQRKRTGLKCCNVKEVNNERSEVEYRVEKLGKQVEQFVIN